MMRINLRCLVSLLIVMLILGSAASATTGWSSQTSATTKILRGVHALSPSTAVAVGNDFAIIKTTDYGSNWTAKVTEVATQDLYAVHFPSSTIGYAVGDNTSNQSGYITKTTDGGENWGDVSVKSLDNMNAIYDVYFASDTTGFVCGVPTATDPPVYRTTDGGSTWADMGGGGQIMAGTYNGVHFADTSTGWVVGDSGRIYKTTDGGTNWSAQTSGVTESLYDVFFLDADKGWIVGENYDFGAGNVNGLVMRTTDGGTNWSLIDSGRVEELFSVHFINANTGWAVGQGNDGVIIKTTNGGTTWAEESAGTPDRLYGVSYADSYSGWAVGGNSSYVSRYSTDPTITSINPSTSSQGDTLAVTIEGTNFLTGITTSSVTFSLSGITVNSLTRNSSSKLTLNISVAAGATTGVGDVTIINPDSGSVTETNAFSVNPFGVTPPTITSITPEAGGQGATLVVTLEGSNFLAGPTVVFRNGGITINSQTNDATSITMNITISASAVAAWRAVSVTNSDSGVTSKNNLFKVNNAPVVLAVAPMATSLATGYADSTASYYVTGNYFQSGASASFTPAGITVNSVRVDDSEHLQLNITIPAAASLGAHSLIITNPDNGSGSLANALSVSQQSAQATIDNSKSLANPNPWNPLTGPLNMQFLLTKATQLKLTFFTINGEKLHEIIVSGVAGYNKVSWNGTGLTGHVVPGGMFLVNIVDMAQNKRIGTIKVMVHRYL